MARFLNVANLAAVMILLSSTVGKADELTDLRDSIVDLKQQIEEAKLAEERMAALTGARDSSKSDTDLAIESPKCTVVKFLSETGC